MILNKILILFSVYAAVAAAECGIQTLPNTREDRVVNGDDAAFGQFPWNVIVIYDKLSPQLVCAGVLISEKWALTVAHCYLFDGVPLTNYQLRFGEFNYKSTNEPIETVIRDKFEFFKYPQYDSSDEGSDIALLKFAPVVPQPHIQPICLPTAEEDKTVDGKIATFNGWGRTFLSDPYSLIPQVVQLPIISNAECQRHYASSNDFRINISSGNLICAGYRKGKKSPCQGEGGGPLQLQRENGKWYVVGLLSRIDNNCTSVATFTRIGYFIPWIRREMRSS